MSADRHLLFGLLALQCGFVSKEQLVAALSAWMSNKQRSLEEILVERKSITEHQQALLIQLEQEVLNQHAQSAEQSLAALSSIGSVRKEIEALADIDLNLTLGHLATRAGTGDTSAFDFEGDSRQRRSAGSPRYRTIRLHAKGGLGEVFIARDEELHREVALKEIQEKFADHGESRARFKLEAEITGNLEHPGIVPVYGLGQYDDGRPYYAMRFIRGESLKEAIEKFHSKVKGRLTEGEAGLELRKLLRRFVDVCNAMEYAHSRGVLHRDLKPGNIILGKYGETLVVDWGLAKAQGTPSSTDSSMGPVSPSSGSGATPTLMGSAVGTPAYMSPEQAAGKIDELGPATDVYALGATLFHLLTGKLPIAGKSPVEIIKLAESGAIRKIRQLRGDVPRSLEAVCLKAMAKLPQQRYASPLALAEEVEKWLADESVLAYAEPLVLRARRWVRRHPAMVSTSAATAVLALAGALFVAYLRGAHATELESKNLALAQKNATISQQKTDLESKNGELTLAKNRAESVTEFLVQSFRKVDPEQDGKTLTVYDALVRALKEIDEKKEIAPLNKAAIFTAMIDPFIGLGMPNEALVAAQGALPLRIKELGTDHSDTIASQINVGMAYTQSGDLKRAIPILEQTVESSKSKLGADDPVTLAAQSRLALAYDRSGKVDLAIPLHEATYAAKKRLLGEEDYDTLKALTNVAYAYRIAGRYDESIALHESAFKALLAKFGAQDRLTDSAQNNLALAYVAGGKLALAIPLVEANLKTSLAKYGEEHPRTLTSQQNLAYLHNAMGRPDLAIPIYEKTLRIQKVKQGEGHLETLTTKNNLAAAHLDSDQADLALPIYIEAVKTATASLGEDHPQTLSLQMNLSTTYSKTGKQALVAPLLEAVLQSQRAGIGADHPDTLLTMSNLAQAYLAIGRHDEAIELQRAALAAQTVKLGELHPLTLISQNNLSYCLLKVQQFEEGVMTLKSYVKCYEKLITDDASRTRWLRESIGAAERLIKFEQYAAAQELLEPVYALRRANEPDLWGTFNTQSMIGGCLLGQKKYAEAEPMLLEGYAGMEKRQAMIPPAGKHRMPNSAKSLIALYTALEKSEQAAKWTEILAKLQAEQPAEAEPKTASP